MDSEAMLIVIEANPVSNILRVSGELSISVMLFVTIMTSVKAFKAAELFYTLSKYGKTFDST